MLRPTSRTLTLLLAVLGVISHLCAQDGPSPPEAPPKELAWQIALGVRVYQVNQVLPLVDRVVLVPDATTYLEEVSKWSPRGRWPVLIEDDYLAGMFIRRFQPAEVIRRSAIAQSPLPPETSRERIEEAVVRAWDGTPGEQTPTETFRKHRYPPPGVVITSADDPAWTAAVALAAGRGQPIAWLDGPYGHPDETLTAEQTKDLRRRIDALVAELGYPYGELGDVIETITLCRAVGGKADLPLPASAQPSSPSARLALPNEPAPPYAITDLIGRHEDGRRYAVTGWIFGDEKRCAYMAMCSLFLPRTRASLISMYPTTEHWAAYDPAGAAESLKEAGYKVRLIRGPQANVLTWQRVLGEGLSDDLILMNTSGMPDFFNLPGTRLYPQDVPILSQPAALQLVHSWALSAPENPNTVGGRWLERGAYAIVGAMHEPFLAAFVTPGEIVMRLTRYGPFLVSARQYDPHPFSKPWKVNTLGDPLMLLPTVEAQHKERIEPTPGEGANLIEEARTLMRACAGVDADGETFATAIATLDLLGRDEIAFQLWRAAEKGGFAAEAARPALGPLFRQGERAAFLRAWRAAPAHDERDRDLLWHIMGAELRLLEDEQTLQLLESAIRPPNVDVDLRRLAPPLAGVFGNAHVHDLVQRHLEVAEDNRVRTELNKLLEEYH